MMRAVKERTKAVRELDTTGSPLYALQASRHDGGRGQQGAVEVGVFANLKENRGNEGQRGGERKAHST